MEELIERREKEEGLGRATAGREGMRAPKEVEKELKYPRADVAAEDANAVTASVARMMGEDAVAVTLLAAAAAAAAVPEPMGVTGASRRLLPIDDVADEDEDEDEAEIPTGSVICGMGMGAEAGKGESDADGPDADADADAEDEDSDVVGDKTAGIDDVDVVRAFACWLSFSSSSA